MEQLYQRLSPKIVVLQIYHFIILLHQWLHSCPNSSNLNPVSTDGSPKSIVNSTIQALEESLLMKESYERSTRLAGDAGTNTNANTTAVAGNKTNFSKCLGANSTPSGDSEETEVCHAKLLQLAERPRNCSEKFPMSCATEYKICIHPHPLRYTALEDFDNGIKSYRHALRVDSRHYNAWYGLGMIFLRQEKFEFSEHHFRTAFHINPRSSVITSFLEKALHALKTERTRFPCIKRLIY